MIEVTLYSREDCHLCEQALSDLAFLQNQIPHKLTIIDVDSNRELQRRFGFEVPVVEIGPYRMSAPIDRQQLQVTLLAAQDREKHLQEVDEAIDRSLGQGASVWTSADRLTYWYSRHYMAFFNFFVLIFFGLPILAPVLMKAGIQAPARLIYKAYGLTCHQLAFRSFFLFGEQSAYPRTAAGVRGVETFGQATGLAEGDDLADRLAARQFVGNETVGYKVALCERDIAIYGSILLFGVLFALTGNRLVPLPWYLWLLLGIAPIALDGVSQLLGQPPLSLLPYRESTPVLRTLTGGLFGFMTAWFGYPLVEESMSDARRVMEAKLRRVRRLAAARPVEDSPGEPAAHQSAD